MRVALFQSWLMICPTFWTLPATSNIVRSIFDWVGINVFQRRYHLLWKIGSILLASMFILFVQSITFSTHPWFCFPKANTLIRGTVYSSPITINGNVICLGLHLEFFQFCIIVWLVHGIEQGASHLVLIWRLVPVLMLWVICKTMSKRLSSSLLSRRPFPKR